MESSEKRPLAKEADKYIVRLPKGMREKIAAAAKASNRSMNAEIVARLEKSFIQDGGMMANQDLDAFVETLAARLADKLKAGR